VEVSGVARDWTAPRSGVGWERANLVGVASGLAGEGHELRAGDHQDMQVAAGCKHRRIDEFRCLSRDKPSDVKAYQGRHVMSPHVRSLSVWETHRM
jgi:hypothetical protein